MPIDDIAEGNADVLEALSTLLEEEATALRTADFAALAPLAEAKERLATQLASGTPHCPPDLARSFQARAQRNAMLLEAAQTGLRQAQERIRDLTAPPAPLQTYDGTGRRSSLATPPGTERRA